MAQRPLLRPLLLAVTLWCPTRLAAQLRRELTVRIDNDAFNFWLYAADRSDDDYTSGVRVAMDNAGMPWWRRHVWPSLSRCDAGTHDCVTPRWWIGQDIYNPERDEHQHQRAGTHPNAGWLYYAEELRRTGDRSMDAVRVTYGVTGPPALGEALQEFAHSRAPRLNRPTDWSSQIQFEPGLDLRYERERILVSGSIGAFGAELLPAGTVSVGNVLTEATAGLRTRFGFSLDNPWRPAETHERELAFTAGVTGHAVAHDLFLDGNTFRRSPRVTRVPFVSEQQVGLTVRYGWFHGGYDVQWDSRMYENGRPHIWSTMTGGVVFSP